MKKCLVVSGPFVPVNEPMTLLPYKQLRLLDFEYDVVALKDTEDESLRTKLDKDPNFKKFNIEYVEKYNNVLFSIKNVNLIKALYCMRKYIQLAYNKYLCGEYEYLYTSSFPAYTHRVGYKIKKLDKKIKWIANFTDPINNSPYKRDKETYDTYSLIEKIAFHAYSYYYVNDNDEIIAFENADLLVFICEEQRDFMIEQYLTKRSYLSKEEILNKSCIVPLNTIKEWEDKKETKAHKNNVVRLSHFGRVYGLRNIEKFIYAVYDIVNENPNLKGKFIIEQYGEFKKKDVKLIKELSISEYFEINDKLSYELCLDKMNKSDILLIFDTIMEDDSWQPYLPSKIVEYSLLKKNVFAIANIKSPTYRIMKKSLANVANYETVDIKNKLLSAINGIESKIYYDYKNEEAVVELEEKINRL